MKATERAAQAEITALMEARLREGHLRRRAERIYQQLRVAHESYGAECKGVCDKLAAGTY